jgi:uncharacterized protein
MPASYRKMKGFLLFKKTTPFGKWQGCFFISQEVTKMLLNISNGQVLAKRVHEAYHFWSRLKGLMFTKSFPKGDALHLQPCQSIHTFFMQYNIDVLYLDKNFEIIAIEEEVKPKKVGKHMKKAYSVVELPSGLVKETNTIVGHVVRYKTN